MHLKALLKSGVIAILLLQFGIIFISVVNSLAITTWNIYHMFRLPSSGNIRLCKMQNAIALCDFYSSIWWGEWGYSCSVESWATALEYGLYMYVHFALSSYSMMSIAAPGIRGTESENRLQIYICSRIWFRSVCRINSNASKYESNSSFSMQATCIYLLLVLCFVIVYRTV